MNEPLVACPQCDGSPCEIQAVCRVCDGTGRVGAAALEARANALVEYANSLPDWVTTEAFAEAELLRREARKLRELLA